MDARILLDIIAVRVPLIAFTVAHDARDLERLPNSELGLLGHVA